MTPNPVSLDNRVVGPDTPAYIIAEAGSNHNGDFEMATRLIEVAAEAGVDAVKFQLFRAESQYVKDSGTVEYLDDDRSIYEIIEENELPETWISDLATHCERHGVDFLCTPTYPEAADILSEHVPAFKVASYTMSHHPFLEYLAELGKPIILSTGVHELSEVQEAVAVLEDADLTELVLLQCVGAYPTPVDSINVRVLETLREQFDYNAGLSDHTQHPTVAPSAAVALGATVLEKHFTLDKTLEGPDHEFALEPDELAAMVNHVRQTEKALGSKTKTVLDIESELYDIARRHIHATVDIEAGELITEESVSVLRSGQREHGLKPKHYSSVIGTRAARDIPQWKGIEWEDLS